jgi:hypothetical protein
MLVPVCQTTRLKAVISQAQREDEHVIHKKSLKEQKEDMKRGREQGKEQMKTRGNK